MRKWKCTQPFPNGSVLNFLLSFTNMLLDRRSMSTHENAWLSAEHSSDNFCHRTGRFCRSSRIVDRGCKIRGHVLPSIHWGLTFNTGGLWVRSSSPNHIVMADAGGLPCTAPRMTLKKEINCVILCSFKCWFWLRCHGWPYCLGRVSWSCTIPHFVVRAVSLGYNHALSRLLIENQGDEKSQNWLKIRISLKISKKWIPIQICMRTLFAL